MSGIRRCSRSLVSGIQVAIEMGDHTRYNELMIAVDVFILGEEERRAI